MSELISAHASFLILY